MLGLLLITAAGLKSVSLFQISTPPGDWAAWCWTAAAIAFEAILGVWLISGWQRQASRWLAMIVFSVFAVIALEKAVSGSASCGCFGDLAVHPWLTFAVDLTAVLWLAVRPAARWSRLTVDVGVCGLAALLAIVVAVPTGNRWASLLGGSSIAALDPQDWPGNRWPLLASIDVGDRLSHGQWRVLLHRPDCDKCREVLDRYRDQNTGPSAESDLRTALVEVAEIDPSDPSESSTISGISAQGSLSLGNGGLIETPLEIDLSDGVVRRWRDASGIAARLDRESGIADN